MSRFRLGDTICAISTPPGSGGVGIIRLSGPQSIEAANRVFCPSKEKDISEVPSHTLHHGYIINKDGKKVDEVVLGIYRAPNSYTKEDVVEVNGHGNPVVLKKILDVFLKEGMRLAERGEFTKRAFLNGRLDLAQAEAVLDVIEAKSHHAAECAMAHLEGKFSSVVVTMREKLIRVYANLEASIDFPEEDLTTASRNDIKKQLKEIADMVTTLISSYDRGRRVREGITIVLAGKPNVGKSSLLNVLLGRNRALVSALPGTTRDAIEELVEWRGHHVRLVDTAGMGTSGRPLDKMSREKTNEYLTDGHLLLFIMDGSVEWDGDDENLLSLIREKQFIPVINKIDLPQSVSRKMVENILGREDICLTSARTQKGIEALEEMITEQIGSSSGEKDLPWMLRERQKIVLEQGRDALERAVKALEAKLPLEVLVFDLKQVLDRLGELIGEVYTEDILDKIFSEFCIGK